MSPSAADPREERVLVLAPTGRDREVIQAVLSRAGIVSDPRGSVDELCSGLQEGAGALLIAEEALAGTGTATLARALAEQEPWSDVPVVVSIAGGDTTAARARFLTGLEPAGNVTIVERPVRVLTLVTAVQAALRARRRQYSMRELLQRQELQMELLRTERELRERFVSLLAHDLRGPLATAKLYAQRLAHRPERAADPREMAEKIDRNLDRASKMISDLLDVSQIQGGHRLPLQLAECDLVELAREVRDELNAIHGRRVVLAGEPTLRGIWGPDELRRALWNLGVNAVKYGDPEAPITVTVRATGGGAEVSVHNLGPALPPAEVARLFEPFSRARSSREGGAVGWGLGLTLVRGCAEAHGGSVRVESTEGAGTTFTLVLPLDARPFQQQEEPGSALVL